MAEFTYYDERDKMMWLRATRNNGIKLGYRRTEKGVHKFESVKNWFHKGLEEGFSIMQDPESGKIYEQLKTDSEREVEKIYRESYLEGSRAAYYGEKMPKLIYKISMNKK